MIVSLLVRKHWMKRHLIIMEIQYCMLDVDAMASYHTAAAGPGIG